MATIAELWARWEAWLAAHAPGLVDGLREPATAAEIADAEEALGTPLPGALRELYQVHGSAAMIVGGYDIATLEDLVETRELLCGLDPEAAGWFPFVDHGSGDHYAVDGRGRVIEVVHDDDGGDVLAADLATWMEAIVGDLERGLYRWNETTEMFEPETLATGFRWLSTDDGRRNAFVVEPGEVSRALAVEPGRGIELVSVATLDGPSPDALLYVELDGERAWSAVIDELEPGDDSGPNELEIDHKIAAAAAVVGVANCDRRYYLFHQSYDIAADRLERGLANLKRLTSVGEIEPVLAQVAALVEMGFDAEPALAGDFYRACARAALELATGGKVFEATRLVRALFGAVGAIGGPAPARWHLARAAVDVAIEANDPELVGEIDRELIPAMDLAAAPDRQAAPEATTALYNLACLSARFGDKARCLRYAELALERRVMPAEFREDPDFEPLAGDADFAALLERYAPHHDTGALYLIISAEDRRSGPVELAEGELRNDRDAADDDRFWIHGVGDLFVALEHARERAALLWPARVHADSDLVRDDAWGRYRVDVVDLEPALALAGREAWELLFDNGLTVPADALTWPARNGWTEAVEVLCDRGADLAGGEPLFYAAFYGHRDTAALLVDRGAALAPALERMVAFNNLDGIKLLEQVGADLSAVSEQVLAEADAKGLGEVVGYLRSRR